VSQDSIEQRDRARHTRIFWIVVISVVVEVGLYIVTILGPAMSDLVRPVYYIVALVAAITVWHALRRRVGHDRRHGDRRHRSRDGGQQ
jgi:membrane protein YdbS with pleckstrin-like domain